MLWLVGMIDHPPGNPWFAMMSTATYSYSPHSPIEMRGTIDPPVYIHSQQQDPSSSNPPSPRPSSFSQSYPNPGYQPTYLQPSFHSPYQPDKDGQWRYQGQYEGPQYLHQQPQKPCPPAKPETPQPPQLRYPRAVKLQAWSTPTQPQSHPSAPTSPPLRQSPQKSDPPVRSPPPQRTGRGTMRQPYHPTPPSQRSEWVMWAGNVPSGTTAEELWEFFGKPPDPSEEATEQNTGVSSIFPIARSNCAFVNFETEAHLTAATARFSGRKIRPDDPKCPNLVCRVRRKTDDLKAGVGGQRGVGMHMKWVQERKQKGNKSPVDNMTPRTSSPSSTSDGEDGWSGNESSSFGGSDGSGSESLVSATSSLLVQHFPKRYFILKSLTQVRVYIFGPLVV